MGQKIYHDMLMPLRDSMPTFMNFGRVLDLLEFKNQVSQCLRPRVTMAGCLKFIPISCMGPRNSPQGNECDFSTNFGALEHVVVAQI